MHLSTSFLMMCNYYIVVKKCCQEIFEKIGDLSVGD